MNIHDYFITIYVSSEPVFNLWIVFLHRLYLMPTVSGEYLALILNFCCYLILQGNPSDIFACSPCLHVGSYIILLLQLSISLSKTAVHPILLSHPRWMVESTVLPSGAGLYQLSHCFKLSHASPVRGPLHLSKHCLGSLALQTTETQIKSHLFSWTLSPGTTSFLCYVLEEHHKIFTHSLPPFRFNVFSQDTVQQAPALSRSTEMAQGYELPP